MKLNRRSFFTLHLSLVSLPFSKELVKILVESRVLTDKHLGDAAVRVDDNLRWVALDGVVVGQMAFLGVINVLPRQLVFGNSSLPSVFLVSTVDAEDFKLVLLLGIVFLHLGKSLDAPSAP